MSTRTSRRFRRQKNHTHLMQTDVHIAQERRLPHRQRRPDGADDCDEVVTKQAPENGVQIIGRHLPVNVVPRAVLVVPIPEPWLYNMKAAFNKHRELSTRMLTTMKHHFQ